MKYITDLANSPIRLPYYHLMKIINNNYCKPHYMIINHNCGHTLRFTTNLSTSVGMWQKERIALAISDDFSVHLIQQCLEIIDRLSRKCPHFLWVVSVHTMKVSGVSAKRWGDWWKSGVWGSVHILRGVRATKIRCVILIKKLGILLNF